MEKEIVGNDFLENEIVGNELGSGGTSHVYEWGNNEVIKIYKPHVTEDAIENEAYIGQLLNGCKLDIPKYVGLVFVDGKKALIYQRVKGNVMAETILKGEYKTELAQKFAELHYQIHVKSIDELPSQHDFLRYRIIYLSDKLEDKVKPLLELLDSIPVKNNLCHGDFQPLNIIGDNDKYVVIDWNGACSGNAILDVAWTYMTMNSPIINDLLGETVAAAFYYFIEEYLLCYCKIAGVEANEITRCLPVVAARRLFDNIQNDNDHSKLEREWLMDIMRRI